MAGFKVGPEAMARFQVKHRENQKRNTADLQRRLAEKAAADPEGDAGIYAEMLNESIAAYGDLR